MSISGSEHLLEALITFCVFGAFYVLFNVQLRGKKRDRLINIILDSYPSGVTSLDNGEVTISWTNGKCPEGLLLQVRWRLNKAIH